MIRWQWGLLALSAVVGQADTLTLASGTNYVAVGAARTLTVTSDSTKAETFERLYAGNGYFYLMGSGGVYLSTNRATGALAAGASSTAAAEQFQTTSLGGANVTLVARSTSAYVAIVGSAVMANATAAKASVFTLTATADAAPQVGVDFANPRQKVVGFGAADAFYSGWLTAHPNKEQIYALLFGRDNLGASILRVQNVYGQTSTTPFDADTAEVVAKANRYRGSPITVLMSSWSPPANLKASGKVSCGGASVEPGCTLAKVNGAYNYAGFAQYWYDSLNAYAGLGVIPNYISLQNEPDFTPNGYGGCRFDAFEQPSGNYAGFREALDAVYTRLQAMPNPPAIVGPEVIGLGYGVIEGYLAMLSTHQLGEMSAIVHHLYHGGDSGSPDSYNSSMLQLGAVAPSMPLFQTEFDHSKDQTSPMNTAWLIHDSMASEETSAYLYWSYFWPDASQLVYIDNPWTTSSWTYPGVGYHVNDYYYAVEHFSRFVQPGFQRFASPTGLADLRATAYYDRQGHRLVLVLINTSATNTLTPELALDGLPHGAARFEGANNTAETARPLLAQSYGPTAVYRSTFSGTDERFASLGSLPANNVVTLPPQAVATVVVDGYVPDCRIVASGCQAPAGAGMRR